jgi:hypothetical protein
MTVIPRDDALPVGQHCCANPNHVHAPDRFQTPQRSEVIIEWDDRHTSSIQHNDMAQVERVTEGGLNMIDENIGK